MARIVTCVCAECGNVLAKNTAGLWESGPWFDADGVEMPATACPSGYVEEDQHVPDMDLPDSLEPAEVEAWLAR